MLTYQKSLIRTLDNHEVHLESHWNFYPYFEDPSGNTPLKKVHAKLDVVSEKPIRTWADYAREVIWFGKRHSVMLLTNITETVVYKETEA